MIEQECTLTVAQSQKHQVIQTAIDGHITDQQAAGALGLSVRQVQRLKGRVHRDGPAGIRRGNAGKEPHNKLPKALRRKILNLAATPYAQYNFSHLADAVVSRTTWPNANCARWWWRARPASARSHKTEITPAKSG